MVNQLVKSFGVVLDVWHLNSTHARLERQEGFGLHLWNILKGEYFYLLRFGPNDIVRSLTECLFISIHMGVAEVLKLLAPEGLYYY